MTWKCPTCGRVLRQQVVGKPSRSRARSIVITEKGKAWLAANPKEAEA